MPTLPPDPASGTTQPAAHQARRIAESFGTDAEGYDRVRPAYPQALVQRIVAGRPGLRVLDVGCGTGIAARQLQEVGATVLGVEPDERMAAYARAHGVPTETATFETWEAADRRFDVVTAAQSWHWVDPVIGPQQAADVLEPGGRLAVFGHVFEAPGEIHTAFVEAVRRMVPDSPFSAPGHSAVEAYQAGYAMVADSLRDTGSFERIEQWRFDWTRPYTRDEWLALLPTTGNLTTLPPESQKQILDSVGRVIDARGGHFTMEYVTLCATGLRRPPS